MLAPPMALEESANSEGVVTPRARLDAPQAVAPEVAAAIPPVNTEPLTTPPVSVQGSDKEAQKKPADGEREAAIRISTKPPTQQELFRADTEAEFRQRLVQEAKQAGVKLEMTEYTTPGHVALPSHRDLPYNLATYQSSRLCYGRLFFQQRITERYGEEMRLVQPIVSTGRFYYDVGVWPLRLATLPWRPLECNDDDAGFVWDRVASPRYPWWLW